MALGISPKGALSGAATGASIGSAIPGIGTAAGAIGGGIIGLFSGSNKSKEQEELMKKAWEYEKEGMGLQYQYGQQAANAEQQRNLDMWNKTNYEAQVKHMKNAGLSVGLMYGNGGGQMASSSGGKAAMPGGGINNPIGIGLQYRNLELQNKAIESQNILNTANAAKSAAEAKKIGGVDTEKTEAEIKWQEIENRIQISKEAISVNDITRSKAEADKAIEEWKQSVKDTEYANETYEQRVQKLTDEIALIQKEGAVQESIVDVNYRTARKIQKEIDNFYYEMITRRMTAEAAKAQAENMLIKIKNEYELGKGQLKIENERNLREWIYGGIGQISDILGEVTKLKNAEKVLELMKNKFK